MTRATEALHMWVDGEWVCVCDRAWAGNWKFLKGVWHCYHFASLSSFSAFAFFTHFLASFMFSFLRLFNTSPPPNLSFFFSWPKEPLAISQQFMLVYRKSSVTKGQEKANETSPVWESTVSDCNKMLGEVLAKGLMAGPRKEAKGNINSKDQQSFESKNVLPLPLPLTKSISGGQVKGNGKCRGVDFKKIYTWLLTFAMLFIWKFSFF